MCDNFLKKVKGTRLFKERTDYSSLGWLETPVFSRWGRCLRIVLY